MRESQVNFFFFVFFPPPKKVKEHTRLNTDPRTKNLNNNKLVKRKFFFKKMQSQPAHSNEGRVTGVADGGSAPCRACGKDLDGDGLGRARTGDCRETRGEHRRVFGIDRVVVRQAAQDELELAGDILWRARGARKTAEHASRLERERRASHVFFIVFLL
eukprot:TRINITY_DN6146_c0_g2_i5.p1 TRINITY_DN6146_c0_g2~~TRINITY_DN6146_c0_g2_i5.p1  ORF type:complete len:159 (+),score=21.92 TRINITY_DN6146_c0_g2_i5:70-546(+)